MIRRWLALTYYFCTPCGSPPCLIFILTHYNRRKSSLHFPKSLFSTKIFKK